MRILSIDTSCDETAAAVTEGEKVLSNTIWSQASLHAKWGGVVPSIAKREHQERIDWVINKSLAVSRQSLAKNIDAIAVTIGPGLAIALEVGISKAKELSKKYNKPFIPVNHIEGHLLSCLAQPRSPKSEYQTSKHISNLKSTIQDRPRATSYYSQVTLPAFGIVASGGHTEVVWIEKIGNYQILAQTSDDALGESLDKAARLLGFGYPGGAILEKVAKDGNPYAYPLPIPLKDDGVKNRFSFSGLKTAFVRLIDSIENPSKQQIADLAASFQRVAFQHVIDVISYQITNQQSRTSNHFLFCGGGVMANTTLRKLLRQVTRKYYVKALFPYSKRLYTDNAAMVGIAAYARFKRGKFLKPSELDKVERVPRVKVDKPFPWE